MHMTANSKRNPPRGHMNLEFLWQEDADACYQELSRSPIFLFGRPIKVEYTPSHRPDRPQYAPNQERHNGLDFRTVYLSQLPRSMGENPQALLGIVSTFGEIVDLRIGGCPHDSYILSCQY